MRHKYIVHLLGISLIVAVFYLVVVFVEKDFVLSKYIIPPAGVRLSQWLDDFKFWATVILASAAFASFLWYAIFQWGIKVNDRSSVSGKRVIWCLFFLIPISLIILGFIFTRQAQGRGWVAYLFYILNGIVCYFLPTALFSPLSFKYTPVWAAKLRRWW